MRRVATIVLFVLVAPLAQAGEHTVPPAYTAAARAHDVPPVMLYALALTESAVTLSFGRRPWPWTLNIAGNGEHYRTRAAACQALQAALRDTRVIDVGLGQLNIRWQRDLFGDGGRFDRPCTALNPYANLDAAATILREGFEKRGDWIEAAGYYHRPAGGKPAARYRAAFQDALASLRSGELLIAEADDGALNQAMATQTRTAAATTTQRPHRTQQLVWIGPDSQGRNALD